MQAQPWVRGQKDHCAVRCGRGTGVEGTLAGGSEGGLACVWRVGRGGIRQELLL